MKIYTKIKDPDFFRYLASTVSPDPDNKAREDYCQRYFEHGEYGMLEYNTATQTGVFIPIAKWP